MEEIKLPLPEHTELQINFKYISMSELMSDDDDETVILASAIIVISRGLVVHFCVITVLRGKGVILCVLSCHQRICLRHVCCVLLSVWWSLTLSHLPRRTAALSVTTRLKAVCSNAAI